MYYQEEGQKRISKWILNQNKVRNLQTEQDLKQKGQQEPGLITADGLIINGNRRFVLIQKLYNQSKNLEYSRFKVVILNDVLSDEHKKIKEIEIRVQFGKDNSLDYKRIDKMLTIRDFKKDSEMSNKEIQKYFKWQDCTIPQLELTLKYMDDYLMFCESKDYQLVDETEDNFKHLSINHSKLENDIFTKKLNTNLWKPKNTDFEDFKYNFFKLLRFRPNQNTFRTLVTTKNKFNILSNKGTWDDFKSKVTKHYNNSLKEVEDYKWSMKKEKKVPTLEEVEKIFRSRNSRNIEDLCLETEHLIKNKSESGELETLLDSLTSVIVKINSCVNAKRDLVKDNCKKKLRKSIENILAIIKTIEN